jgi:hypothetical protein
MLLNSEIKNEPKKNALSVFGMLPNDDKCKGMAQRLLCSVLHCMGCCCKLSVEKWVKENP